MVASIERVQPKEVNGVELYVSNDGKRSGMSQRGLARFCDVPESTLRGTIDVRENKLPKQLQHLWGKVFECAMTGTNKANIISSEAAAEIIEYYAFERQNPVALKSYRLFAKAGIHAWILSATGFTTTESKAKLDITSIEGMEAAVQLAKHYIQQQKNMLDKPGLAGIMEEYSTVDYPALPPSKITLKDYLAAKGIELSKSEMIRVSSVVAATYKAHRGHNPEPYSYSYFSKNGKKCQATVNAYSVDDYPLIDAALELVNII